MLWWLLIDVHLRHVFQRLRVPLNLRSQLLKPERLLRFLHMICLQLLIHRVYLAVHELKLLESAHTLVTLLVLYEHDLFVDLFAHSLLSYLCVMIRTFQIFELATKLFDLVLKRYLVMVDAGDFEFLLFKLQSRKLGGIVVLVSVLHDVIVSC